MPERKDGLVVLDFDGVLNEGSPDLYYQGYHVAFSGVGCELTIDEQKTRIDEKWGSSHVIIINHVLQETQEYADDAKAIFEEYMESVFAEGIKDVSGSAEMLGRLASKYCLALNTAAPRRALLGSIMPRLGIDPSLFNAGIVTADQLNANYSKPSPYIINILRAQQGFLASETVMIGDSDADMRSARDAAVEPIAVTGTGNLNSETVKELPYVRYVVDTVIEVEGLLPEIIVVKKNLKVPSASITDESEPALV